MTNLESSPMFVTLKGKHAVEVVSLEQAVLICANYRDTADYGFMIGAEQYYRGKAGRVMQGDRKIAQIHYNGRVEVEA